MSSRYQVKVIKFSQAYMQVGSRQSKDLEQNFLAKETETQKAKVVRCYESPGRVFSRDLKSASVSPHPIPINSL